MPMRQNARTSPRPVPEPVVVAESEVPMRIWPHPICCDVPPAPCPTDPSCPDLGAVLEQLQCQSQLLLDLLGAVNSLTAACLCRDGKN